MNRKIYLTLGLALIFILSACANLRYMGNPAVLPTELGLHNANDDFEVVVRHRIVPDGSGSWIRGAKWDEFVIALRNFNNKDIVVERISLIDVRGGIVGSEAASYLPLDSESENTSKYLGNFAGQVGVGTLGTIADMTMGMPLLGIGSLLMPYVQMYNESAAW